MSAFTDSLRHEEARSASVLVPIGGPRTEATQDPAFVCRGFDFSTPPGCEKGSDDRLPVGDNRTYACARCGRRLVGAFSKTAITRGSLEPGHVLPTFRVSPGDKGLTVQDWITDVAPPKGDSFLSVDRSVDVGRYAGFKLNSKGMPWPESIRWAARYMSTCGASPDTAWFPLDLRPHLPDHVDHAYGTIAIKCSDEFTDGEVFLVRTDTWVILEWPESSVLVCMAPGHNARMNAERFHRQATA